MYDKYYGHHDCDCHCPDFGWGPHGPDGPVAPLYRWPDIYHPVPYGEEWRGNKPLMLGGCHPCPPRDWARHNCEPIPYHGNPHSCDCPPKGCHVEPEMPVPDNAGCNCEPCDDECGCGKHDCFAPVAPFCVPKELYSLFDDYVDLLHKYCTLDNCTDQCKCVEDLEKVRGKIQALLRDIQHTVNNLGGEYNRLQKQVCYYMGKTNFAIETAEEAMQKMNVTEEEFNAIKEEFDFIKNKFCELSSVYPIVYQYVDGVYTRITSEEETREGLLQNKALVGVILDEDGKFSKQVYCVSYTMTENSFTIDWELDFTDENDILASFKGTDDSVDGVSFQMITPKASSYVNGSVNTSAIASNAVTEGKLATGAVTTNKLSNGAVTIDKLDPNIDLASPEATQQTINDVIGGME